LKTCEISQFRENPASKEYEAMNSRIESKLGSTIISRINEVQMPEMERQRALSALYDAHLFVDGVAGIVKKIEQMVGRLFLKPVLKH
jgi:hypothetical protein